MYRDKGLVSTGVGNLIDATRKPMTPATRERAASQQLARRFNWIHPSARLGQEPGLRAEVDTAWVTVKASMNLAPQVTRLHLRRPQRPLRRRPPL